MTTPYLIDAHLDLAWNALQWNRDLTQSVQTLRVREGSTPGKGRAMNTVALPELRRGRFALCFATLLARSTGRPLPHVDFDSAAQAYGVAQGQLAYYRALAMGGHVRLIGDLAALDAHVAAWDAADAADPPPLGIVVTMESADPILSPDQLPDWWAAGLRLIGPAHQGPGRYVGGTGTEIGFNDQGYALLRSMESLGFILDLTHLPDGAFWDALDRFGGPVIASHHNCRTLVPNQRQLADDQIRAIQARDGVIGMGFDAWMLKPGWVRGVSTNDGLKLAAVVDHIDHICQLTGSTRHVGIGSDLDGGYGREQTPCDLDTIADLQTLAPLLVTRGYSAADVEAIFHGNWLRLLRASWKAIES